MADPLFWLVLSLLFVTISLTVVLAIAIPTLKELGRAARSADKLFETLRREFPPTLESIRLTSLELNDLTEDLSEGVQSAGQVVKQVDQTITGARTQAKKVQLGTRSLVTGIRTAWKSFTRPQPTPRRSDRLPPAKSTSDAIDLGNRPTIRRPQAEETTSSLNQPNSDPHQVDQRPAELLPHSLEESSHPRFISKDGEVIEQREHSPDRLSSPAPASDRNSVINPDGEFIPKELPRER